MISFKITADIPSLNLDPTTPTKSVLPRQAVHTRWPFLLPPLLNECQVLVTRRREWPMGVGHFLIRVVRAGIGLIRMTVRSIERRGEAITYEKLYDGGGLIGC